MKRRARARLRRGLRIAFSALVLGACAWFVRNLPLRDLGAALSSASVAWVAVAAALNLAQVYVRALLLHVLLLPVARVPSLHLFGYSLSAFAANNLLPGRAGEVVRIFLLRQREGVPTPAAVGLVVIEKAVEVVALLLVVAPLPLLLPRLPPSVSVAIEVLAAGGGAAAVGVWAIARFVRGDADRWYARFAAATHAVRRPALFLLALLLAMTIWIVDAVEVWMVLRALHLHLPWAASLLTLLVLNLAIAVPSTPAAVGPFEAAAAGALGLMGVPLAPALAFALIYHAMQVIPVTLLGAPGLRLARRAARAETPPAPQGALPARLE